MILRNDVFRHLQRLPMSFFHRTKVGRIISRMVSDVEDVRTGVQEVLFVSLVQLGQMLVAAASMLWYDAGLFLLVLGMVPILWFINRHFHRRLSHAFGPCGIRSAASPPHWPKASTASALRRASCPGHQRRHVPRTDQRPRPLQFHGHAHAGLVLPLLDLNNQAFVAALMVVGGYQAVRTGSHVDIGDLVGFFFMAGMFFSPINVLGAQYNQALTAMAGAERIFPAGSPSPNGRIRPAPRPRGCVAG